MLFSSTPISHSNTSDQVPRLARCSVGALALTGAVMLVTTFAPFLSADAAVRASGVTAAKRTVAQYSGVAKPPAAPGPALNGAKVAALKGKTVLYVPFTLAGPPFLEAQASLKAALADVGITMTTCDPNGVPSSVSSCLNNAKTDGASAIVTGSIPYSIAPNAYKTIEAAHIPTLASVAGPGNPASSKYLAFQADNQQSQTIGQVLADTAIADTGGKGNILYVSNTDSTASVAQANATLTTLKKQCPDCTTTHLGFSIANLAQVPSNVSSAVVSHPGVNFILSQVDILLPLITQGLASTGDASRIKDLGGTGSLSTLQAMAKDGTQVVGDVGVDYDYLGWVDADGVIRMLLNEPVPANPLIPLRVFTPSNVRGLTLTPTADIDTWFGVSDNAQRFNKLWGIK
jgi:ribose transport system substrate-binding protein